MRAKKRQNCWLFTAPWADSFYISCTDDFDWELNTFEYCTHINRHAVYEFISGYFIYSKFHGDDFSLTVDCCVSVKEALHVCTSTCIKCSNSLGQRYDFDELFDSTFNRSFSKRWRKMIFVHFNFQNDQKHQMIKLPETGLRSIGQCSRKHWRSVRIDKKE